MNDIEELKSRANQVSLIFQTKEDAKKEGMYNINDYTLLELEDNDTVFSSDDIFYVKVFLEGVEFERKRNPLEE